MTVTDSVILSVVEGFTEYLPISSTGHMIITSYLLGINDDAFTKDFTIIVQFGAIFAVLVLYWKRFLAGLDLYKKLFVAFLPAAILGLAVKNYIDRLLGSILVVAWATIIGGVILIIIDKKFVKKEQVADQESHVSKISFRNAFQVGCFQCLAFIPGMSRSASTIVGGLLHGFNRRTAAEFSFFLAVPTLTAATGLKLLKVLKNVHGDELGILLLGNVISFIVGALTVKLFIDFLTKKGLSLFGYYRIILGTAILIMYYWGSGLKMVD